MLKQKGYSHVINLDKFIRVGHQITLSQIKLEFNPEAGIFHGEVLNLRNVITLQGKSVDEIEPVFKKTWCGKADYSSSSFIKPASKTPIL